MKVDDPRMHPSSPVTPTPQDRDQTVTGPQPRPTRGDEVSLSEDVHLARRALTAALSDETRSAALARAHGLYDRGELGADVNRLADRIIDSLLDSHDPGT